MFDQAQGRAPPAELIRGLAVFAEPPTEEHRRLAEALDLPGVPTASDYSDLFLFQLYPYASVHLGPEGMMGGEARSRVAGFWRALGYEPPAEPDHLAALLGLYATLAERERETGAPSVAGGGPEERSTGDAALRDPAAERRLLAESRGALLHEHLAPWVFGFLGRVRELSRGVYGAWAGLLEKVLREEIELTVQLAETSPDGRHAGPDRPLHLREAPPLPDPRHEGAADFVAGLLAPVRSGVLITRADLAKIASACDVGLRAGERRYALEHLLAQDGAKVLKALAGEARRQGGLHEERVAWLGATGRFLADRAEATADLLDALADEEREPVAR